MLRFSLVLTASLLTAQTTTPPEPDRQLARSIYKEFVEIQSGFSTGSTTPVAEAAARYLKSAGFPDSDIFIGGASPKKANLVVRYHGTGARKPILLLAHTDVVEANREDWSMDPFQFTERDGFFYGRGTGDDKAQAAVWIASLVRYKREGFKPDRDIIVALTADEEGGGPYNGVDWLLKNHRDLIDAEFCLNEGGWGEEAGGKKIANDIQVSEKYVVEIRFEVRNKGGHSSMPVPDNAIYHLAAALDRLSKFAFPLKTNEVTAAYFKQMATLNKEPIKTDLAKAAEGDQQAMARVANVSPAWNATLRTTCVATQLEGGHARNALPQLAAAGVNCRVLPEDSVDYVKSTSRKSSRRQSGESHHHRRRSQRTGLTHAPRHHEGRRPPDRYHVARRPLHSDHGDGRNRWKIAASSRHPNVWRPRFLHGPRRHPLPRPRRTHGRKSLLRRPAIPIRTGKNSLRHNKPNPGV